MFITASCSPTHGKAQPKLLNLEEGGKIRQPDPGLGKVLREGGKESCFKTKAAQGTVRQPLLTSQPLPTSQSARLGFDF